MNLSELANKIPFLQKPQEAEYFFTLGISQESLEAAVWSLMGNSLQILNTISQPFSLEDDLVKAADLILDKVLGDLQIEPKKILFGVPDSWLTEGDLKEGYLKTIRSVVKELDLEPLAYVATTRAVTHFLEKQENTPPTAILVGIEKNFVTVYVSKVGRIEGVKTVKRGEDLGTDVEKLLLTLTNIEVLPSRILIYSSSEIDLAKEKEVLAGFSWMSKLPFLHLPKIETLEKDFVVSAVSLAGGVELNPQVKLMSREAAPKVSSAVRQFSKSEDQIRKEPDFVRTDKSETSEPESQSEQSESTDQADIPVSSDLSENGFMVGDVAERSADRDISQSEPAESAESNLEMSPPEMDADLELSDGQETVAQKDDLMFLGAAGIFQTPRQVLSKVKTLISRIRSGKLKLAIPVLVLILLVVAFLILPKAQILVYVEPRVLEKDTQVVADPALKKVDESNNKIPGQIIETTVSGSDKASATGKKSVGDPAKGSVTLYNKTDDSKTFSKGTTISSSKGLKFALDSSVTVASQSAVEGGINFGKTNVPITAAEVGADGNLPSGTEFSVAGFSSSQFSAKANGNFSGGTSKEVTVVTDSDQQKLLATLAAALRTKAQADLQNKLNSQSKNLKILPEALAEEITQKTFNKRVGDQASEFSLNLIIHYKGTAYSDEDLKSIVSKLVSTDIPADFELNLAQTETLADVSKLEKDGKLIFLARFNAKLMPKLDINKIKSSVKGKTPAAAADTLKTYENVLGSEIKINPSLPSPLQILPILEQNIKVEIGLK